ncbi:tRNA intron endonuclease [Gongronella butleri]|nr:tRNA intron endonuclease [Gongronella butleri]
MARLKKRTKGPIIPFPIPLAVPPTSWASWFASWFMSPPAHDRIKGTFMDFGRFVWIHSAHQEQLITQGFFGKGTLSRSVPTWHSRLEQGSETRQALAPEQVTAKRRTKRRAQKQQRAGMEVTTTNPEDVHTNDEMLAWTEGHNYEEFQLDLYETFFLIYALDVLDLEDKHGRLMSAPDCWSLFHQSSDQFVFHYAAYHYYRSLGWVPKDGLKFGVDFVLYRQGATVNHSDFSVIVVPCVSSSSSSSPPSMELYPPPEGMAPMANWVNLLRINRVCVMVKKTLVICYVSIDKAALATAHTDLTAIEHCKVHEVVLRRWSPSANRE